MDAICEHLQACGLDLVKSRRQPEHKQRCKNFIITVPPRCLKTEITQIFFVAWLWLHAPWLKIRCVSANQRVINKASRECREVVSSKWYQETFGVDWEIRHDADAVGLWANTARGERYASTSNQRIIGEGTDIIIVDDPHDAHDAQSDVKRQDVLDKWDTAIRNRVNSAQHLRIGIMQRTHEADWAGHVLAKGGWEHLMIPHEFEVPEPGRQACRCEACARGETFLGWSDPRSSVGDLMIPGFYDRAWVENEKRQLGPYNWAGQHQQRPAPLEGGLFKRAWFKFFDLETKPRMSKVLISVDAQFTKEGTSQTAIIVVGTAKNLRYVLDDWTKPRDYADTAEDIRVLADRWNADEVLVEKAAAGIPIVQKLTRELGFKLPVKLIDPKEGGGGSAGDKLSRANAMVGEANRHEVLIAKGQPWTEEFLHELCTFPNAQHDDRVDALGQAITYLRGSAFIGAWKDLFEKGKPAVLR